MRYTKLVLMNIYLTSCETGPNAWRHQEEALRKFWALSSHRHRLVDAPHEAEIIIIGNLRDENWCKSMRTHPIIRRYVSKCFAISEVDAPSPLLRGVYTSAHTGLATKFRFRTAAYNLYHPDFQNPFVAKHEDRAFDEDKKYLYTFLGRNSHPIRSRIFSQTPTRKDIIVRDTSAFELFTHESSNKSEEQKKFTEILEESKFALCPRGNGAASIRLFEAMKVGVAPIIISDGWILPKGPKWDEFALFVKENDVEQIERIAINNEPNYRELGRRAAAAYATYFADEVYFDYLVQQFADIKKSQKMPEYIFWLLRDAFVLKWKIERKLTSILRHRRGHEHRAAGNEEAINVHANAM